MMMKHFTCILITVCWLSVAAGCRGSRTPEGSPAMGNAGSGEGTGDTAAAPTSMQRPGRGFGRNRGNPMAGSGRAQYLPVRLTPAEVEKLGIITAKAGYQSVLALHPAMGRAKPVFTGTGQAAQSATGKKTGGKTRGTRKGASKK